ENAKHLFQREYSWVNARTRAVSGGTGPCQDYRKGRYSTGAPRLASRPRYSGGGLGRGLSRAASLGNAPSLTLPRSTGGGKHTAKHQVLISTACLKLRLVTRTVTLQHLGFLLGCE